MIMTLLLAFSLWSVDSSMTLGFSNTLQSPLADAFFKTATLTGNRENILLYSALFTVFADTQGIRYEKQALIGGAITSGFCTLLKYVTNRERPEGRSSRWNSSFPSGHATMSSFIAVYFGTRYPRYRIPLYLWSVAVGASRIYLKRHWVSDVITGYMVGTLGAYLTLRFYDKHLN